MKIKPVKAPRSIELDRQIPAEPRTHRQQLVQLRKNKKVVDKRFCGHCCRTIGAIDLITGLKIQHSNDCWLVSAGQNNFVYRNLHLYPEMRDRMKEVFPDRFRDLCDSCSHMYGKHAVDCQTIANKWVEIANALGTSYDDTDSYYLSYELRGDE